MRPTLLLTMIVVMVFFLSSKVYSLDINTIIQGKVEEIRSGSIGILKDINNDKLLIHTNSNTVYDNAQKLTDLKVGDEVQIEYEEGQNKITASTITKIETGIGNNF